MTEQTTFFATLNDAARELARIVQAYDLPALMGDSFVDSDEFCVTADVCLLREAARDVLTFPELERDSAEVSK